MRVFAPAGYTGPDGWVGEAGEGLGSAGPILSFSPTGLAPLSRCLKPHPGPWHSGRRTGRQAGCLHLHSRNFTDFREGAWGALSRVLSVAEDSSAEPVCI